MDSRWEGQQAPNEYSQQPGLEVSPYGNSYTPDANSSADQSLMKEQPGLEVSPYANSHSPGPDASLGHSLGKEVVPADAPEASPEGDAVANTRSTWKKPWVWIAIAAVVIVVVVAAVVGGVVGSRSSKHNKSDDSTASNSSSSNKTNPIAEGTTFVRKNTALAVTAYRNSPDDKGLQLFYQGNDQFVYSSVWNSTQNWTSPVQLQIGAIHDTPMAVSIIYATPDNGDAVPQVEFFYQNASRHVRGENFQPTWTQGLEDSIAGYSFEANEGSQLASYWPTIVYQDSGAQLRTIWYDPNINRFDSEAQSLSSDSVTASDNSPLLVLPVEANHPSGGSHKSPEMKLIYRRDDGNLYEFNMWSNGTTSKNNVLEGFAIGASGALAGFATAGSKHVGNVTELASYVVYQADNGTIFWGSNIDSAGWKGPRTDPVFSKADHPTHLACATIAAGTEPDVVLPTSYDMSRCYFQQDGKIVEVSYDGSKWSSHGEVPLEKGDTN